MHGAYDVIVIGSGIAGLSAAIEAAEGGASVLLIEQMKKAGGNSLISDGGMAAAGTADQKLRGIDDSPSLMFDDMMRAGKGLNNPALVRLLTEQSAEAYAWAKEHLKIPFLHRVDTFGGHSVPRCYTAEGLTGKTFVKAMTVRADRLGVAFAFGSRVRDFKKSSPFAFEVEVEYNYNFKRGESSGIVHYGARKGLILSAGGFGADIPFRKELDSRLDENLMSTCQPFAKSGILRKAMEMGAHAVDLSRIQLGPWASPDEKGYGAGPFFSEYILFQYGIVVDPRRGERIVNEMADRAVISDALLAMGRPAVGISDHSAVVRSGWDIGKALSKGVVRQFDSLADLAEFYGIECRALEKTVRRFNSFLRKGMDGDFGKPFIDGASEIAQKPFYGIRLYPKVHYTMGGLAIDCSARVLDRTGVPVPGLYGAGEITGGIHGASRLGSCSITDCIVYGRIAANHIINH